MGGVGGVGGVCGRGDIDGVSESGVGMGGRSVNRERFYGGGTMRLVDDFTPTPTPSPPLTHVPKIGNFEDV